MKVQPIHTTVLSFSLNQNGQAVGDLRQATAWILADAESHFSN